MTDVNFNALKVQESDMTMAWNILDQMRNAVIEGSKLAKEAQEYRTQTSEQMEKLGKQVEELTNQVHSMRAWNTSMGQQNAELLAQVAQHKADVQEANAKIQEHQTTIAQHQAEKETQAQRIAGLESEVQALKKERDDAQMSAMEWEEKAEGFRKRLETVRERVDGLTSALGVANPTSPPATLDQDQADTPVLGQHAVAQEVATPVDPSGGVGGSPGGDETQEQKEARIKREQPRDPVTQQWRSPNDPELAQAAKPWWQSEH